jgi:hypothetical protein
MDMFMALPCWMNVVFICVYTEDMMTLVTQMGRQPQQDLELRRLRQGAKLPRRAGLLCHLLHWW